MAGTRSAPAQLGDSPSAAPLAPATITSSSDNRDYIKCPTFNGKNFLIRQRKVKSYLAVKTCFSASKSPLPEEATAEVGQEYIKAAQILGGHVSDDIYNHVITNENTRDAFEIWKELKNRGVHVSLILAARHGWFQISCTLPA
ncbi:hypothetical protein PTTG_28332 [Puccinia triticina 1-1 BBBD Race 1]|uniref:Uncharacterized protein n=1 Tax=Puccinia triticina (isolate 1-1 / race 1 (BBBD)) TaxID=630390 RepID=A0A180GD52_PUCT1|nr:hypothetical protein PTTG_28332 [Puccinia triticina 1-1 BBBD Race 1]